MRTSLLYNPRVLVERIAIASERRRRFRRLRGTPAAKLGLGHIDTLELIEMLRPAPAVIYDIGANVGTWTCLAKSLISSATVEAFEPLSQHFAEFARWTAAWPNDVRLHRVALGDTEGTAEMVVTDYSDASSLLPLTDAGQHEFNIKESGRQSVAVTRLDTLLAAGTIVAPDLIKLDVQGFELAVLRGGTCCLEHATWILSEVSFRHFYRGQALFHDIAAFLDARGFEVHAFGKSLIPGAPTAQVDVLFKRRS